MSPGSWLDAVDDVDQDTVETQGATYPWIQWVNGKPELKQVGGAPYTGGWFASADHFDEMPEGWTRDELIHRQGNPTEGFFAQTIRVAPIRSRRAWLVTNESGNTDYYPWNQYDNAKAVGKASGKLQVLVALDGALDAPLILTMRGMVGKAFTQDVLGDFQRFVLKPVNALVRKGGKKLKFPWRAFWLTVGCDGLAKGEPVYTTVGRGNDTSKITLPVANHPGEGASAAELRKLFVGQDNLRLFSEWYTDADEWAHAWDEKSTAEAAPAADNGAVPPLEDDEEIPF